MKELANVNKLHQLHLLKSMPWIRDTISKPMHAQWNNQKLVIVRRENFHWWIKYQIERINKDVMT